MQKKRKAQFAMEYLMIFGIMFVILTALMIVYFQHSRVNQAQISSAHADNIVKKLIDNAEEVYYLGYPAKTTLQVYVPPNVDNIIISNNEINFRIKTGDGISDIEQSTFVNLSGYISKSQGMKTIEVFAKQNGVCIIEKGQTC